MTTSPADRSLFATCEHTEPHSRAAFTVAGGRIIVTIDVEGKSIRVHGVADRAPFHDPIVIRPGSSNAVRIHLDGHGG